MSKRITQSDIEEFYRVSYQMEKVGALRLDHDKQLYALQIIEQFLNPWIIVEDQPPEPEVEVLALCFENGGYIVRQLDYSGKWHNCHGADYTYNVTHWTPRSKLPKQSS